MKNRKKIFWFMAFHAKFWMGHNYCILGLIKYIDLSEPIMELDIQYYWEVKNMISFTTGLDIIQQ